MKDGLSVIVPVYNAKDHLQKCVNSIQLQKLDGLKIILVDDGSSDGSSLICDEFSDIDDRVLTIHQKNQGPIAARYQGLLSAETKYVTFVDSDDWIEEDCYESFERWMTSGIDVIKFGHVMDFLNNGKCIRIYSKYREGKYNKFQIQQEIYPTLIWDFKKGETGVSSSLCNKIVKREILLKSYEIAKNLKFHYCEDSAIVFPMFQYVNSLIIDNQIMYHHCKYDEKISSYLGADDFFDNLFDWYKHLIIHASYLPHYRRQIDYIYMEAAQPRKLFYGNFAEHIEHVFPYKKIKKGSKILLYGYGAVGRFYEEQIIKSQYCSLIGIADRNWKGFNQENIISPEKTHEYDYDYIVISIQDEKIRNSVCNEFTNQGIDCSKIIF